MTAYIISAHFYNSNGHHFNYYKSIRKAFKSNNVKTVFIVPKKNRIENQPDYNKCLLEHKNKLIQFIFRLLDYTKVLSKIMDNDYLLIEDYRLSDLVAFLISSYFIRSKFKLHFLIRDDLKCYPKKEILFRKLFSLIEKKYIKRVVFLTDSEIVQKTCSNYLKTSIHVLPIPHTFTPNKSINQSKDLKIWIPGNPNTERGDQEILNFINFCDEVEKTKIFISKKYKDYLNNKHNISFLPPCLSENEYIEALNSSDFILLLYNPSIFSSRTSGRFVEAITANTMPIVLKGSWLAYELEKFNISNLIIDPADISHNLVNKLYNLSSNTKLIENFGLMQKNYLSFHNEENFIKQYSKFV